MSSPACPRWWPPSAWTGPSRLPPGSPDPRRPGPTRSAGAAVAGTSASWRPWRSGPHRQRPLRPLRCRRPRPHPRPSRPPRRPTTGSSLAWSAWPSAPWPPLAFGCCTGTGTRPASAGRDDPARSRAPGQGTGHNHLRTARRRRQAPPAAERCGVTGASFLLGHLQPGWLGHLDGPLFVSHRTLRTGGRLPRAGTRLDHRPASSRAAAGVAHRPGSAPGPATDDLVQRSAVGGEGLRVRDEGDAVDLVVRTQRTWRPWSGPACTLWVYSKAMAGVPAMLSRSGCQADWPRGVVSPPCGSPPPARGGSPLGSAGRRPRRCL